MVEKTIQQQILLFTGTHFSSRQCLQKMNPRNKRLFSESEQLQDACWNGLLKEMLPEISEANNSDLYLWQIKENKSSITIGIGELPAEVESFYSIDPYPFLETIHFN